MQYTDVSQSIRKTIALTASVIFLSGCLSQSGEGGLTSVDQGPQPSNSAPTISGNPTTAVNIGNNYAFTPNASDADGDSLTFSVQNLPSWADFNSGTGRLSGQPTLGNVGVYRNILISVSDGQVSTSLSGFSISVNQAGNLSTTLSWNAPTQNEDGSTLTDLAGYKIYWGTTPGVYTNSVTIDNPGLTTYVVGNLSPGTYEFVATAFNWAGVESRYSGSATKTLN